MYNKNKKKILFDAKWLYKGPPSGKVVVDSYVNNLINYLDEFEITLLIDYNDKNKKKYEQIGFKTLRILNVSLITNLFIYPVLFYFKKFDIGVFQNSVPILFKGKKIQFIHDIIFESNPEFFTIKERILFKWIWFANIFTHFVITISENEKKRIIKYKYGSESNVFVIYNGADHLKKNIQNKIKLENNWIDSEYCLYVGRINDRKNIKRLIEAFDTIQNLNLVIVGSKDWLSASITSNNPNIIETGYLNDTELSTVYQNAKFLIFVSLEEGFGLPPIEAMHYKVPVIVSNCSCFLEVCKDAALYVDPYSVLSIKKGILEINDDSNLRSLLIKNGEKVAQLYKWSKSTRKMIDLIKRILLNDSSHNTEN